MLPQVAPSAAQVVGWQQVRLALQTCPLGQAPQLMLAPLQSSVMMPQSLGEHAGAVQALHWPLIWSQDSPLGHVPQSRLVPQPSAVFPHSRPFWAQVFGAQQLFLKHVCPAVQSPQLSVPPQPSFAMPQLSPSCAQVLGVQEEQTLSMQVWLAAHVPQFSGSPVQLLA
jgi:hypothetical protein